MCVGGGPEPQEGAVKESSSKLPTGLKVGYVERSDQPQSGASGFYDQERGRGNAAPKATGVIQATATSPREQPEESELRDLAIRNLERRIDNRADTVNPLMPGGTVLNTANAVGNMFAERMIRDLRAGFDPITGFGGDVIGTRNPETGELATGRDELQDADTVYQAQQQQRRREAENKQEDQPVQERPESATNPSTPDGNRRSMIALNQARSSASSRGPGRRSLF